MGIAISCQNNNINLNDIHGLQLINQFCSCPDASSLLASLKDLAIDVIVSQSPNIRISYPRSAEAENIIKNVQIEIPEHTLKRKDTILNFVLELFNAKHINEIMNVNKKASEGKLNVDAYAKAIEKIEHTSQQEAIALLRECNFAKKKILDDHTTDLETHLWNKEFDCHTDKIRSRWIESYLDPYCEKHPKAKSCKLQKQDLCDHYALNRVTDYDRYLFRMSRLCERLPKLPQKVKDWYASDITKHCQRDIPSKKNKAHKEEL